MQLQSPTNPEAASTLVNPQPVQLQPPESPKTLLLVDDDDNSPVLLGLALKLLNPRPLLQYVPNAIQAKGYLTGRLQFANRIVHPFPDLVLLDLRMPIMDGFEFLDWARSEPEFKTLPILVLTDSVSPKDLTRAYQLGATSFLVKPTAMEKLIEPLKALLRHRTPLGGGCGACTETL